MNYRLLLLEFLISRSFREAADDRINKKSKMLREGNELEAA